MERRYTVGTANRYEMFLGEEEDPGDPMDIKKLIEAEKARKALKNVQNREPKVNNKERKEIPEPYLGRKFVIEKIEKNDEGEDMETVKNRRNREERYYDYKARNSEVSRPGPSRRQRQDSDRGRDADNRPRRERREPGDVDVEGHGDRRTGLPPRPRRTSTPNRRKREFERKSGSDKTGVKAMEKRDGAGAHNWGTLKDDLGPVDVLSGEETDVGEKPENEAEPPPDKKEEDPVALVEEVRVLTLDEYRALRGKRQQPKYNLRRAGEGEDPSLWKNFVELESKKKDSESYDEEELDYVEYPQRVGRLKHVLDIDITFKEPRKFGGRGRGFRPRRDGEGREKRDYDSGKSNFGSRRQGGGYRDQKFDNETIPRERDAPKVDDVRAFPSLN